jgi:hypothetical protein
MSYTKITSYEKLCLERDGILDAIEDYKKGNLTDKPMGLWNNSDYLSELSYIRRRIESDIVPYYIVETIKLYNRLSTYLPDDIIYQISNFCTSEYQVAFNFYKQGITPTIENIT